MLVGGEDGDAGAFEEAAGGGAKEEFADRALAEGADNEQGGVEALDGADDGVLRLVGAVEGVGLGVELVGVEEGDGFFDGSLSDVVFAVDAEDVDGAADAESGGDEVVKGLGGA